MNRFFILFLTPFIANIANAQDCFPFCDTEQFKPARCEILCDFDFWQDPTIEVVRDVLDDGVNIHANDGRGWQVIHYAAMFGTADMVVMLLDAGADPNGLYGENSDVVSPILIATNPNYNKLRNSLINNYPSVRSIFDENPFSRIHRPTSVSDPSFSEEENDLVQNAKIVEALISAGADLNVVGLRGRTALHKSSQNGNVDIVRMLVDAGAKVDVRDDQGLTPLHSANRQLDGVKIATILLDGGADIDAKNNYKRTTLYIAVDRGYVEKVRLLIDRGADLNARNSGEETPLFRAVRLFDGHSFNSTRLEARNARTTEIAKMLIEAGAPIDTVSKYGLSLLDIIRQRGGKSSELEAVLLEHGVEENEQALRDPYCSLRTRRGVEILDIQIPCE